MSDSLSEKASIVTGLGGLPGRRGRFMRTCW